MAEVTLIPGRVESVAVSISSLNRDLGPLPAKELRIGLSNPEAGIEPIERQAVRADDATWAREGATDPRPRPFERRARSAGLGFQDDSTETAQIKLWIEGKRLAPAVKTGGLAGPPILALLQTPKLMERPFSRAVNRRQR